MGYKMYCDECGQFTEINYVGMCEVIHWGGWTAQITIGGEAGLPDDTVLCVKCLIKIIEQGVRKPTARGERGIPIA